jgi:phasin family protein
MASKKTTAKAATNVVDMKKPATTKTTASKAKKAPAKAVKKAADKKTIKTPVKKTVVKKKVTLKAPKKATAKKTKTVLKTKPKATAKTAAKPQAKPQTQARPNTFTQAMPDMTQFLNMETLMPNQPFKFDQISQDATNATRESSEAFLQSGAIFAKGFETMLKTAAAMTQTTMEKQAQYAQEIMGAKTLNEAAEKQSKIAQANFDEFMSSATTLSEMSVKLLNDSAAPLNEQMAKAMQNAQKMAA